MGGGGRFRLGNILQSYFVSSTLSLGASSLLWFFLSRHGEGEVGIRSQRWNSTHHPPLSCSANLCLLLYMKQKGNLNLVWLLELRVELTCAMPCMTNLQVQVRKLPLLIVVSHCWPITFAWWNFQIKESHSNFLPYLTCNCVNFIICLQFQYMWSPLTGC